MHNSDYHNGSFHQYAYGCLHMTTLLRLVMFHFATPLLSRKQCDISEHQCVKTEIAVRVKLFHVI